MSIENKYLESFTEQYNQLMGYLNPYFKFGITLSLNRKMSWKQGFDEIERKLKAITGDFTPISIRRIGENETVMIISEHTVPETGNKMKVYHLIFQLNDSERREVAKLARKKNSIIKEKEVVKLLMINKRSLIYGVPILGLASYIMLLLYDCLWYHIRGVIVYIG